MTKPLEHVGKKKEKQAQAYPFPLYSRTRQVYLTYRGATFAASYSVQKNVICAQIFDKVIKMPVTSAQADDTVRTILLAHLLQLDCQTDPAPPSSADF